LRRKYSENRWNWSQRAKKWVYIESKRGKRYYKYQIEPPQEFFELTKEIKLLNDKLMATTNNEENERLFRELSKISRRMQEMGKKNNSF